MCIPLVEPLLDVVSLLIEVFLCRTSRIGIPRLLTQVTSRAVLLLIKCLVFSPFDPGAPVLHSVVIWIGVGVPGRRDKSTTGGKSELLVCMQLGDCMLGMSSGSAPAGAVAAGEARVIGTGCTAVNVPAIPGFVR